MSARTATRGLSKPRSWKARRRGATYCAPACGHGCTWEMHQEAWRRGRALAARLGPRWKVCVHENMGWHYHAVSPCGAIEVSEHASRAFWANVRSDGDRPQFHARGSTPRLAVKSAIAEADTVLRAIESMMARARKESPWV